MPVPTQPALYNWKPELQTEQLELEEQVLQLLGQSIERIY